MKKMILKKENKITLNKNYDFSYGIYIKSENLYIPSELINNFFVIIEEELDKIFEDKINES